MLKEIYMCQRYLLFVSSIGPSSKNHTHNVQKKENKHSYNDADISSLSKVGKSKCDVIKVYCVW